MFSKLIIAGLIGTGLVGTGSASGLIGLKINAGPVLIESGNGNGIRARIVEPKPVSLTLHMGEDKELQIKF
ncbi:MAG: hypothetical protein V3U57_08315 [Robiginitomaculum sp.]